MFAASASADGLTVDLLLLGYRLFGVTYQVNEKVRLGDLLNSTADTLLLKHTSIISLKGQVMAILPEVSVHKSQLVAAIPKESEDYQSRQRAYRAGMIKPDQVQVPVLAVVPPYAATGKVHVAPHADLLEAQHSGLARFFPLTDAVLFSGEDRLYQGPIVLLNRSLVATLGKTGEPIAEQRFTLDPRPNDLLSKIVTSVSRELTQ
jgi:hypothetical protein